ncbi:MAG: aminotransferase class I/II-fold pyridoxal phosphate-dependent enzyme [Bacteroidota bacterium]
MNNLPPKLQDKLKQRELSNSLRTLSGTSDLIDFSSNDYLGFSRSSDINERALAILNNEGNLKNGATGSRLLTGNHELYTRAEQRIAHFHSSDTALIFNSGYDANLGLLGSIGLRGDVLLYDELCHASIRDGLQLGKANSYKFKHNDLNDLRAVTARVLNDQKNDGQVYVVTESVFSMDGDSPNLNELCQWCEEKEYRLIVDEAHAVGVAGPKGAGLMDTWGLTDKVFARIVTFGKALGVHGAAVLCGHELREFLINFARSFIYTTGLPPHSVAAVIAAYEKLEKDVSGINKLHRNIELLRLCVENSKLKV